MHIVTPLRRPARSVAVLSLGAVGVAGGLTAAAAPAGAANCAPVEVIAARGTGEPQSGSFIMGGLVNTVAQRTGGEVYQVQYPASTDYVNGPNQGATDALSRLQAQASACPQQKFVLAGYSEGAMVITVLLGRIPANLQGRVAAAVTYGNPYHKPNSPSSAGSGKGGNGLVPGAGIPAAYTERTRDYCNAGDPVCGAGADVSAHLAYGQYNDDAVAFVVARVQGTKTPAGAAPAASGSPAPTKPSSVGGAAAAQPVTATPKYTG
jgi:cutinase